jgi:hypothetical protein
MQKVARIFVIVLLPLLCVEAQESLVTGSIDHSGFPNVRMAFRVESNGLPVTGSLNGRIRVTEDGLPVTVDVSCPERAIVPASISIGIERSLTDNLPSALAAARMFLTRCSFFNQRNEASVWTFATWISNDASMTRDSLGLDNTIAGITDSPFPFNGTALYEAMHRAIEDVVASGSGPSKAIVFVTDGVNNTKNYSRTADDVIGRALVDDVPVFVLGVGTKPDGMNAMRYICEATGGFYVPLSDPNAADSVYRALCRQPLYTYWCDAAWTSSSCPNGAGHQVVVQYVRQAGDTLSQNLSYAPPRDETKLIRLPLWITPSSVSGNGGDTLDAAIGITSSSVLYPDSISFSVEYPGLAAVGPIDIDPQWSSWPVDWRPNGEMAEISMRNIGSGSIAAGQHRIGTITLRRLRNCSSRLSLSRREGVDCFIMTAGTVEKSLRVELDTSLIDRGDTARVTLRISGNTMPEGVRDLRFSFRVRAADGAPRNPDISRAGRLMPDWYAIVDSAESGADWMVYHGHFRGRAVFDTASIGVIPIAVTKDAPSFIPVQLDDVEYNTTAGTEAAIGGPGLIAVRDSCRNDIVQIVSLAVTGPWPQPISRSAHFLVKTVIPGTVSMEVRDALGRLCGVPQTAECTRSAEMVFDTSNFIAGLYLARFSLGGESVTVKFIIIE